MKTLPHTIIKISIILTIVTVAFAVNYLYAAWSAPQNNPPDGNTPAPINAGTEAQVKEGALSVDGLTSYANNNIFVGAGGQQFSIKPGFKGNTQTSDYTTIGDASSTVYILGSLEVENSNGTGSDYLWRYENFDEDIYPSFFPGICAYGLNWKCPGWDKVMWKQPPASRDTCNQNINGPYTCAVNESKTCNDVIKACDHSGEPCGYSESIVTCKKLKTPYVIE